MTRAALALFILLAACERHPPAPNAQQNAQLDEAEAMLDNLANESAEAR